MTAATLSKSPRPKTQDGVKPPLAGARIRTLIVDDQLLQRELLQRLLKHEADVEVVGTAANGREAVEAINTMVPDLVFLDVQMPELDGFGVLAAINPAHMPVIVFVTANEEFALKAFEFHALDYIVKPCTRERLHSALQRAREQIHRQQAGEIQRALTNLLQDFNFEAHPLDRLAVKSGKNVIFLRLAEIHWIEAVNEEVRFHVNHESYIAHDSLAMLESKLPPHRFVRVSRSAIVNLEHVKELRPESPEDCVVGTSQRNARAFDARISRKISRARPALKPSLLLSPTQTCPRCACLAHCSCMRELFRSWNENVQTFVLEVIFEERRGASASLVRASLYGLSMLFQLGVKFRRLLYNVRILRDSTLGVQVIAIGNLTVGGTGKTPVVEKFARELRDQGRNIAILSRGYRSRPQPLHQQLLNKILLREETTPPRIVSDGKSLLLDSETAGDEPYMLASNLKDVVVLVDKDRVKSGRFAIEKFGCDTLLLDDGFQYWKLRGRRQDVVLIDRQQPFGNEQLLPRGTLREPPSHLARASVIFITKSDGQTDELRRRISQLNPSAAIIECIHHPLYLEDVFTGERRELDFLKRRKVASLSGIAQPESFEKSLVSLGAELVYSKRFADHHRFTQQEVLNAINRSKKRQADAIITTQKDAVRFPKLDRRDLSIYFMRVEIKIVSGANDFQDCVRKICFR